MANRDNPRGARALRDANGSHPPVWQFDATTSVIYEGEFVLLNTAGLAVAVTATMASTITSVLGAAAAYKALALTAGAKKVQVYVDPDQLYLMQSDDASLDSRTDYIGRNFALTNPAAGNTTTLQSKAEIDGSTGTSVATSSVARLVQIVDKYQGVANVVNATGTASSNAEFIVKINSRFHLYGNSVNKGV